MCLSECCNCRKLHAADGNRVDESCENNKLKDAGGGERNHHNVHHYNEIFHYLIHCIYKILMSAALSLCFYVEKSSALSAR